MQVNMKLGAAALLAAGCGAILAMAGPLNPPGGAPAPTMKTLDQVEPAVPIGPDTTPGDADSKFKIDSIGTYYLTGDVFGSGGKHGIEIAASFVTIDLRGFVLSGFTFSDPTLDGIFVSQTNATTITIRNGVITTWGGHGINAENAERVVVENISASINQDAGVQVGDNSLLRNVVATNNFGFAGIFAADGALVNGCSASGNVRGFSLGQGANVSDCAAHDNTDDGFSVGDHSLIKDCAARTNGADGIAAQRGSVVRDCVAGMNGQHGIRVIYGTTVTGCNAADNGTAISNGAGIRASVGVKNGSNRIEGNTCTMNDIGIFSASGNFIVGNMATANGTDYLLNQSGAPTVVTDYVGTIIPAPQNITTGNPWVNFASE